MSRSERCSWHRRITSRHRPRLWAWPPACCMPRTAHGPTSTTRETSDTLLLGSLPAMTASALLLVDAGRQCTGTRHPARDALADAHLHLLARCLRRWEYDAKRNLRVASRYHRRQGLKVLTGRPAMGGWVHGLSSRPPPITQIAPLVRCCEFGTAVAPARCPHALPPAHARPRCGPPACGSWR